MESNVIITSDVSRNHIKEVTAWAYIVKTPTGSLRDTGAFNGYVEDVRRAEINALCMAIKRARSICGDWESRDLLIFSEIINPFNLTKNNKETNQLIKSINPVLREVNSWRVEHVKAHYKEWRKSDKSDIYGMNRWCDMFARNSMRNACV